MKPEAIAESVAPAAVAMSLLGIRSVKHDKLVKGKVQAVRGVGRERRL